MSDMLRKAWLEPQLLNLLKDANSTRIPFKAAGCLQIRTFHNYRFNKGDPRYNPDELISADVSDKFCQIRCTFSRSAEDDMAKEKSCRLTQLKSFLLLRVSGDICIVEDTTTNSLNCVMEIHKFTTFGDFYGAIFGEPEDFNRVAEARRLLNSHHIIRLLRPQLSEDDEIRSQVSQASSDSDDGGDHALFSTQIKAHATRDSTSSTGKRKPFTAKNSDEPIHDCPTPRAKANMSISEQGIRDDRPTQKLARKRLHTGWGDFQELTHYDCVIPAAQQRILDTEECWMPKGDYAIEPIKHQSRKTPVLESLAKKQRQIPFKTYESNAVQMDATTNEVHVAILAEQHTDDEDDAMSWAASPEQKAFGLRKDANVTLYHAQGAPNSPPPDSSPLRPSSPHIKTTSEKPFIPPALHEQADAGKLDSYADVASPSPGPVRELVSNPTLENASQIAELGGTKDKRISVEGILQHPDKAEVGIDQVIVLDHENLVPETGLVVGTDQNSQGLDEVARTHDKHASEWDDKQAPQQHLVEKDSLPMHTSQANLVDFTNDQESTRPDLSEPRPQSAGFFPSIEEPGSPLFINDEDSVCSQQESSKVPGRSDRSSIPPAAIANDHSVQPSILPGNVSQVREEISDLPTFDHATASTIDEVDRHLKPSRKIPWQVETNSIIDKKLGVISQKGGEEDRGSQRSSYRSPYEIAARLTTPSSLFSTPVESRSQRDKAPSSSYEPVRPSNSRVEIAQVGAPQHTKYPYNFSSQRSSQSYAHVPQTQVRASVASATGAPSQPIEIGSTSPEDHCQAADTLSISTSIEEQTLATVHCHDSQRIDGSGSKTPGESTPVRQSIVVESSPVPEVVSRPSAQSTSSHNISGQTPAERDLRDNVTRRSAQSRRTSKVLKFNLNDLRSKDDGMDVDDILRQDRDRFLRLRQPPPLSTEDSKQQQPLAPAAAAAVSLPSEAPLPSRSRKRKAEEMESHGTPEVPQTSSTGPSSDDGMDQELDEEALQPWQEEHESDQEDFQSEREEFEPDQEHDEEESEQEQENEGPWTDDSSVEGSDTPLRELLHTAFRVRKPARRGWDILSWEARLRALDQRNRA